jgi:hypothetical protein
MIQKDIQLAALPIGGGPPNQDFPIDESQISESLSRPLRRRNWNLDRPANGP